jgi:hypothetical protein
MAGIMATKKEVGFVGSTREARAIGCGSAQLSIPHNPMPELLREYRVRFEEVPEGEKAVEDVEKLGLRSKLGGAPDWIQRPEVPKCRECKSPTSLVAQLDSIEHDEDHNPHAVGAMSNLQQYMFSVIGMIYVFCCFDFNTTKSVLQFG